MRHRIYTTSEKAWEAMLEAIRGARKAVYLELYILDDDSRGHEFFKALEDASLRGVRVVALLDVVGSFDLLSNAVAGLRAAGAEALFCSFFWKRLHRKVLIVDGGAADARAFIGGVNVGKKYARWRDLQVEVRGAVVQSAIRSFARVYRRCGGQAPIEQAAGVSGPARRGVFRKARLWFVDHGIGTRRKELRRHYGARLDAARQSVVIVTPYLFPPRWLIARLHQAMIRGVRVEVIMPKSTDHRIVDSINRSYAACLNELGASCFFTEGMNHAKAMLVDRAVGVIGSQNFDRLSFEWNIEAGVFFDDPAMVRDLAAIIDAWRAEALPAYRTGIRFRWYDIPMAFFLRLFGLVPVE